MTAPLTVRLFGPLEVRVHDAPLPRLRSRQGAWLLALLALRRGVPVERSWLAALLWPDSGEAQTAHSLRVCLADLRRALGPEASLLRSATAHTLCLDLTGAAVDALDFDQAIARGDLVSLQEAVGLYRGPLLEGCVEAWAFEERQTRELAYLGALETLAADALERDEATAAERFLRRAVAVDALGESAQRALMRALAVGGNHTAALQVYQEFRRLLHRELNAEPDPQTQALFQQIRTEARQKADRTRRPAPLALRPGANGASFAHNLPAPLTSFIGREPEMAAVKHLLAAARLLTLTGAGGCGKTRLALQVAAGLLEGYPDGVWLVELAPLADPMLVPPAVAAALGVREQPGRSLTETLLEYLRPRSLLLVLDNCEHLLAACAPLVDLLLRGCPHLQVFASSREGLGIEGEQTYRVPSLSWPDPERLPALERLREFEAMQLFADRAALRRADFAVTDQNAAAVAQVCQRLDGIPLAIELAAACVKALPVEQIAVRLDDRFRLLTGGSRTALPRQQTLRALIDWSYDLLSEPERGLLRRLSVFAGGWTLEAAEAVGAGEGMEQRDILGILTSLIDKSLVVYGEQEGAGGAEGASTLPSGGTRGPGPGRYRLFETVRQYSRDRLLEAGEAEGVRGRHRDWCLALAERARPAWQRLDDGAWVDLLEMESDNWRAALGWSIEREEAEAGFRFLAGLGDFFFARGYFTEARARLAELLALPGCGLRRGKGEEATEAGSAFPAPPEAARRHPRLAAARAAALNDGGLWARYQQDMQQALVLTEESVALWRALDNKAGLAFSLMRLGEVRERLGDLTAAQVLWEESLALYRGLEIGAESSWTLFELARLAFQQGDIEAARAQMEKSLALWRQMGSKVGIWCAVRDLGHVALSRGDYRSARGMFEESLKVARSARHTTGIASALFPLGHLARWREDYETARTCYEEILAIGRASNQKELIATSLTHLGLVLLKGGEPAPAAAHAHESLRLWCKLGDEPGIARCLECLAQVAFVCGQPERMARLFGAAEALREGSPSWRAYSIGVAAALSYLSPVAPEDRAEYEGVAAARAALGEAAFAAAWAEGRTLTLERAIEYGLAEAGNA